jgi:hypothetical protein
MSASLGWPWDLVAGAKTTVRKTREFVIWLVSGAVAVSGKKWSGVESRQTRPAVEPSRREN